MVIKKGKRIVMIIVVLLLVTLAGELIYERQTQAARKVQTIHIKLKNQNKLVYGASEFDVTSIWSMGKVLSFLKENQESQNTYNEETDVKSSIQYEITVTYKTGAEQTYKIKKEAVSKDSALQEVVDSEEVVTQTRSMCTVDKAKVKSIEVCKWSQNMNNDMKKQQITNKETIAHLIEICKEYTVEDPEDSATFQQSELCFYNKKGKVLAIFYFSKESKCYKELVKAVPDIANFV